MDWWRTSLVVSEADVVAVAVVLPTVVARSAAMVEAATASWAKVPSK